MKYYSDEYLDRYQTFFSRDDFYLLRKHIKEIYDEACEYVKNSSKKLSILEVGPSTQTFFENTNTDWLQNNAQQLGHNYCTLDVVGDVDYLGSIEDCSFFKNETFDVVIILSVLEHVANPFLAAQEISRIVKPKGKVYIQTPFLYKVHNPTPNDYWRFTEYAYDQLFSSDFNLNLTTFPENQRGKNSFPLSYNVIMNKKCMNKK